MQLVVHQAADIGTSSHGVTGGNSFAQQWVQWASYSWPVMSSMIGPVEQAFGSGPLRIILPTEVVTVSTYVKPVASSFITWLELMLEISGVVTSPMDRVPTGTS